MLGWKKSRKRVVSTPSTLRFEDIAPKMNTLRFENVTGITTVFLLDSVPHNKLLSMFCCLAAQLKRRKLEPPPDFLILVQDSPGKADIPNISRDNLSATADFVRPPRHDPHPTHKAQLGWQR